MATQAAVHRRNLESSILFMQQEHANTLKALHEEIHNLQKKCSDLTFQMTMHRYGLEENEADKVKDLEAVILTQKAQNGKLQVEVDLKNKKIKLLETEIHTQKKRYLGELHTQAQSLNSVTAELEAKRHNVAYLTSELHRFKLKEKTNLEEGIDYSIRRTQARPFAPAPPKELQSKSRRPHRKAGDELMHRPLRAPSDRSSNSSRSESPDITPFVTRETSKHIVDRRRQTAILPPISASMAQEGSAVLVHQVVPPQQVTRRKTGTSSPEIATLAVDQMSGWVHAQESHSSEYK